jgi:hypothetical protein
MTTLALTPNKSSINNLINLALFQGVWFATVIGAAQGTIIYGIFSLGLFITIHTLISHSARSDLKLAAIAVLIGLVAETLIIRAGLLTYAHNLPAAGFAPAWILILWANLALTLNGCLSWLKSRYLLAAILGAIGGPLSYFGGIKLGAATAETGLPYVLAVIAIIFGAVTPLLLFMASRMTNDSHLKQL